MQYNNNGDSNSNSNDNVIVSVLLRRNYYIKNVIVIVLVWNHYLRRDPLTRQRETW